MNKLLFILFGIFSAQAFASSVWIEQNNRVGQIGGWRTYAKEKPSISVAVQSGQVVTLEMAIERSLGNKLDSVNYLPGSEFAADFYVLTASQRSALQQRYNIIYDATKSYYALVALKEKLIYQQDVLDAVESAAEITARMVKVGNVNQLALLKQNKQLYQARLEFQSLQTRYLEAKEKFLQQMNYGIQDGVIDVASRLPDPPKEARSLSNKQQKAIDLSDINSPASVQARSNARIAYDSYLDKFSRVKVYREQLLPNQKKISEEKLLRYNGMLIDIFHLLEDAEDQSKSVMEYVDANAALLVQSARLDKALIDAQMDFSNINARQK